MGKSLSAHVGAWYRAVRPRTLTATYAPLGLAAAVALEQGVFEVGRFALSLLAALLLQIASNLVNEYADYRRGADALKVAGQGMAIKQSLLTPRQVLIGALVSLALGAFIGLYLLSISGLWLLWIGLFGVLVVVSYTAGPFPLAYHGLGEIAVALCFGPLMVLGAYYVMAVRLEWRPLWASIPLMFTVAAILHANNIRDIEADSAAGKRTLAVRFGLRFARREYVFLMYGGYVALVGLVAAGVMPLGALAGLATLPEARSLVRIVTTETDPQRLHMAQGRTARLHGRFGLLIVVGWLGWLLVAALIG